MKAHSKEPYIQTLPEQVLTNNEDEIDLRVYWQIFSKYKWQIFRLTFLIGILVSLITLSLEPSYRFTTTLLIEFEQAKVISIEEVYGISSSNRDYYQTQLGILKSRKLAEKVTKKLNLTAHPAFNIIASEESFRWQHWFPDGWFSPDEPPTDTEKFNGIVDSIMEQLTVTPVRNSQLIEISFESHNIQLAADIPNTLANIYVLSQ